MSGDTQAPSSAVNDEARLAEIVDVVVAIASNDFSRRASVGDGEHLLDGLATGLNMLAEEVGQQVAREEAFQRRLLHTERLAAIGQLAAGVAHEVNNPAAYVLTNLLALDTLLAGLEAEAPAPWAARLREARDLVREDIGGVERVVAIVRDLRNFSRLESHQLDAVDLGDVVEDACKLVRAELAYRARLVVHRIPNLPVTAERTKLTQVLTNLLMNAAQAIPEGAPEHNEVGVTTLERDGSAVVVVRDTGAGMPPAVQARVFEPFFTTKPRGQGTGLGLAISADIARQHGGELRLVRSSASGTVFELSLPLGPVIPAPPAGAVPRLPAPAQRARVLLVDDEPLLLAALQRVLGVHYDVVVANGGRPALEILERDDRWDVILCDLMMPDLDGAAVFEWLQAHRPALVERTLFCSGGAFTPRGFEFAELIGDRLLQKPIAPPELREAIERVRPRQAPPDLAPRAPHR